MRENWNEEMIRKVLETSSLVNGGGLNPAQQARFAKIVREASPLMGSIRTERVKQRKVDIDKLWVGEPITRSVDENTQATSTVKVGFNKVEISCKKVQSFYSTTHETLTDNIEREKLEDSLAESVFKRIGADFELLLMQGDAATYAAVNTPLGYLLRRCNGVLKLAEGAHILDAAGATISKPIFSAAKRILPRQYRNDAGLRWLLSDTIAQDYNDVIADRSTQLGDRAIEGGSVRPSGIAMVPTPGIPDDLSLSVTEDTYAQVKSTNHETYQIVSGSNDALKIDVDNAGAVTVTLTAGTHTAAEIARQINATSGLAGVASEDDGRVVLKSSTTGASSEIDIQTVANDAYTTIGFTVAVTTGADTSGTVPEGSSILLGNPMNLILAILDANGAGPTATQGTRVYSEYNKDYDRVETVIYNELDTKVENLDALVLIKNVRRRAINL